MILWGRNLSPTSHILNPQNIIQRFQNTDIPCFGVAPLLWWGFWGKNLCWSEYCWLLQALVWRRGWGKEELVCSLRPKKPVSQSCTVAKSETFWAEGQWDNQTWQTEWKTAPLAIVQLCGYKKPLLTPCLCAKFDCPVAHQNGPPEWPTFSYCARLWNCLIWHTVSHSHFPVVQAMSLHTSIKNCTCVKTPNNHSCH